MTLRKHPRFRSQFLPDDRDLVVYLPPGYDDDATVRYPVLYLHDGQNLFEGETAFKRGEHWRVGETATDLIDAHRIEPLIIVGIANTGVRRLHEYTHSHDRRRGGGEANGYGRLVIEELKPFVDRTYRTLLRPEHTGIGGSSLGGLVSLYLGLKRPDVFSKIAALSPSVWWDRRSILRDVRDSGARFASASMGVSRAARPRIWVDIGTHEGRGHVENVRLLKAGLERGGWIDGIDLHYEEVAGGRHSEVAWGDRFGRVLEYLFG